MRGTKRSIFKAAKAPKVEPPDHVGQRKDLACHLKMKSRRTSLTLLNSIDTQIAVIMFTQTLRASV